MSSPVQRQYPVQSRARTSLHGRLIIGGNNIQFWRGERGAGPLTKMWDFTTTVTAAGDIVVQNNPDSKIRYDEFRILADDLEQEVTYAYNDANELTSTADYSGATIFEYDEWGHAESVMSKYRGNDSTGYEWAYGDKLTKFTSTFPDEGTVEYEYRGDQKRHSRTAGGSTTEYQWNAGWQVINEQSSGGALQRTYTVAAPAAQTGTALAHVDGTSPSTGTYNYYAHDNLGSTRGVYGQSKDTVAELNFTPYGGAYMSTAADSLTRRFTGHTWDAATDLHFAPYRYYSAATARWMSRDPLGMIDGPNVYAYVGGQVPIYSDPMGADSEDTFREILDCIGTIPAIAGCVSSAVGCGYCATLTAPPLIALCVLGCVGIHSIAALLAANQIMACLETNEDEDGDDDEDDGDEE